MKKLPVQLLLLTYLAVSAGAQTLRVVNAASFMDGAELSPGSIITVLGSRLTNTTASARGSDLPRSLGGVTVTIGGMPSPLFYVSPTQVNAQIDPRVPLGLALVSLSSPTGVFTANVTISANSPPGVFSLTGTGAHDPVHGAPSAGLVKSRTFNTDVGLVVVSKIATLLFVGFVT